MKDNRTSQEFAESFDDVIDDEPVDVDAEIDAEVEVDVNAADCWSYEVPRPWLSIHEAANMLGRSVRGVERSIVGRWGNKLPEGWHARRVRIDGQDEWRIIPPPGFRVRHSKKADGTLQKKIAQVEAQMESKVRALEEALEKAYASSPDGDGVPQDGEYNYSNEDTDVASKTADGQSQSGFSFEKLLQSAGQLAQKELASIGLNVKNQLMVDSQSHAAGLDVEHTIVIDRSDEVEKLLRELANVQKELSEERRQHMEDMRLMNELQSNMRLLEVNAVQTSELKEDLIMAQKLLSEHKKQYQAYLALPWWKKIFKSQP